MSIPIDLAKPGDEDLAKLEEKGVRGRYASAETLTLLENGKIEWRMATSSTPGGNIPAFVSERTIDSKISDVSLRVPYELHMLILSSPLQDVPLFMAFLRKVRPKPTPTGGQPTSTSTAAPPIAS